MLLLILLGFQLSLLRYTAVTNYDQSDFGLPNVPIKGWGYTFLISYRFVADNETEVPEGVDTFVPFYKYLSED